MAFYKVVVVVDDVNGQLGVTAFEMDQSNVMPPQQGAPMPEAPFDPGRFSVDQITLSELEERSGLDFGTLKDFDVLAAQPVPKSLLRGARLRLPLTGGPGGGVVGSLTLCSGNSSWRKSVHELNIAQLTSACSRTLPLFFKLLWLRQARS